MQSGLPRADSASTAPSSHGQHQLSQLMLSHWHRGDVEERKEGTGNVYSRYSHSGPLLGSIGGAHKEQAQPHPGGALCAQRGHSMAASALESSLSLLPTGPSFPWAFVCPYKPCIWTLPFKGASAWAARW